MTDKTQDAENGTTDTSTEDVSGLKSKNAELIRKLKAAEARAEKAEEGRDEAAENAKAEQGSELDKANRLITKLTKERDDAVKRADDSNANLRTYREEAAISNMIAANKVQPDDVRAVKAIIKMELDRDSDEPSIGGTPLESWGKTFFAKEGKRYVQASDHNGGGATGSDGGKSLRMNKANFNHAEFAKIQLENPEEANAIALAVGKPNLVVKL